MPKASLQRIVPVVTADHASLAEGRCGTGEGGRQGESSPPQKVESGVWQAGLLVSSTTRRIQITIS